MNGIQLTEDEVPKTVTRSGSKYRDTLDEFVASGFKGARLESDANPATLYQQLTKVIKADPEKYAGIKASKRVGPDGETKVWLVKEDA